MGSKWCVAAVAVVLVNISCELNILNEQFMQKDPFSGKIMVRSINEGRAAHLTWEKDANADKYIVMKAEAGINGVSFNNKTTVQKIEFAGVESYIDNDIDIEKSYAYRLDKLNSSRVFEGGFITFLEKGRPDPFPGIITIQNLNNGRSAYLNWQADKGADSYRIMRAINDGSALVFMERRDGTDGFYYQGKTSAIDSMLEDDKGYFYRLDKSKDGVWIPGLEVTVFSRTRPMPFAATPTVKSFRTDGNILINWHYDEGADTYILMRSFDNSLGGINNFLPVYEGEELQYLDTAVNAQQMERYVYKLYKRRNGIIYEWNDRTALGVAVQTQEDYHEPNNTETQATMLETYRLANIYCFGFSTTNTFLEDMDWYRVNIPPHKIANIAIHYSNSADSGYLMLYLPYMDTLSVIHDVAFQVRNDEPVQKYVTFAIIPDRTKFLLGNGTGGSVVGYTITWVSIENN